jgi:hypothetical protein
MSGVFELTSDLEQRLLFGGNGPALSLTETSQDFEAAKLGGSLLQQ